MENLSRSIQVKFRVNALERDEIRDRMKECNIWNMGRYLRCMAINGCIIKPDHTDIKQMNSELNKIGVNINQIAKVANTNGTISRAELENLKRKVDEIWHILKSFQSELQ